MENLKIHEKNITKGKKEKTDFTETRISYPTILFLHVFLDIFPHMVKISIIRVQCRANIFLFDIINDRS